MVGPFTSAMRRYDELKALSGEGDAAEVWTAAAKFEMNTIQKAKSKEEYLKKIQKVR